MHQHTFPPAYIPIYLVSCLFVSLFFHPACHSTGLHAYLHAPTYLPSFTNLPTLLPTCLFACLPAYSPTYPITSLYLPLQNIPAAPDETLSLFTSLPKKRYWIILMTAGGHFAGAVFSGKEVLMHKTFHRYTVRAKRGTVQGARDSQQGGKQPK